MTGASAVTDIQQSIRFLKTPDDVTLAWAEAGEGPALVKVANWLSHLEYDWDSPVWRHWMQFFASNFRFIRYDERGCGMTDWDVGDLSPDRWIEDLEVVVERAKPEEPFALLGISQGTSAAIQFAARYPERVSHLILYGGYALGWKYRENVEGRRAYDAIVELARFGWGKDNPSFRQVFTYNFLPEASEEQITWFNELCRRTTTPEVAARLLRSRAEVNVEEYLSGISVPTLVLHSRDDAVVPIAWERFCKEVLAFTGRPPAGGHAEDPVFGSLSARERQILARIAVGETNAQIGQGLFISDKTVRNHVTRIFEKLGVSSRAQAIVLVHEKGFRGA
jgi:pimeloyl-ACP methyl ester carboxylesterase/DNA-binding CsgD family transcriptional regulator